MKVLFVYPNVQKHALSPQIGIASLSASLKQRGHRCELFDVTITPEGRETELFEKKINSFSPDLIAFSVRSNETRMVRHLLTKVPQGIPTVAGGHHITVAPEDIIDCFDMLIRGEGEYALLELVEKLEKKEDISKIGSLWLKRDGEIIKNELRPQVHHLDMLPYPDWGLFDIEHYLDHYLKRGVAKGRTVVGTFEGSRGCVFTCTYCSSPAVMGMYGGPAWRREKSPRRLADEIIAFREQFGLDFIYFVDEIFLTKTARIREFSEIFKNEVKTPFLFMERPELVSEEKMELVAEAGAYSVSIGIESGDEEFRRRVLDRRHSNETIINAFAITRKHGVRTHAFNMVGLPGETKDTIKGNFELLTKVKPNTFQVSIFYPLRATVLHNLSLEHGWLADETMPDNYYEDSVLNLPDRSKKEMVRSKALLDMFAGRGDRKSRFLFYLCLNSSLAYNLYLHRKPWQDIAYWIKNFGILGSIKRAGLKLSGAISGLAPRRATLAPAKVTSEQVVVVNRGTDPIYQKPVDLQLPKEK